MSSLIPDAPKWPAWVLRVALLLASLALTLGAAEFVLRRFLPVRGMIYAIDDRYLFRYIPGSRRVASPSGETWPKVLVRINAAGRRGDESALPRATHRVVIYGDSCIAAEYTPESDTYAAELGRLLNARLKSTAVLNAGVTGYGIDQESLRIEDELPGLKPELVIVAVYAGNDFGDLLRNKLYRLDDAGRLVQNVPVISEALKRDFQAPLKLSSMQIVRAVQSAYEQWGPRPSDAAPRPASMDPTAIRLAHRSAEYESYVFGGDNVVRNVLADEYDADVSLEPDSPSARYRLRLMARVVERIHQVTEQNSATLLLVIIPERCDVLETCDASAARRRYPGYRTSGLTDALESIARNAGLTSLNLFEPFRHGDASHLYHPLDEHWNAAGQKLAAGLTADAIVRDGLLR